MTFPRNISWTEQPQEYTQASEVWTTRGMVALFDQSQLIDVVNGIRPSSNTATLTPAYGGRSADYSGSANTQYPHIPAYATTGAFSIVCYFDVDAHTNFGALIAKQGTTTTNAPYELRIGPAAAGDSRINFLRAAAGTFASKIISSTNVIPNTPAFKQMFILTGTSASIGTSGEYWMNGFGGTYAGAGGANCTDNGATVWIGRRYDGATQLDGRIYYVALFNRALTGSEAREITDNPWCLFGTRRQFIWSPVAGGTYTLNAETGVYSFTGTDATLLHNYALTLESASYSLTGSNATLLKGLILDAASGSYTLTGSNASLVYNKLLNASSGSYSVTGSDANLIYTPASGAYVLNAESGAYVLTGSDVTFAYSGGTVTLKAGSWIRYRIIT